LRLGHDIEDHDDRANDDVGAATGNDNDHDDDREDGGLISRSMPAKSRTRKPSRFQAAPPRKTHRKDARA
jgi:hypothetical protein